MLDRVQQLKASSRPNFATAWQAVPPAPLQIIVSPSADQHRVLSETFPQFPPPWQHLTGQAISDGIQWAALSVETSPTFQVQLLVQSKTNNAAEQLKQLAATSLQQLAQLPAVKKTLPNVQELVSLVQPQVEGSRVRVTLSANNKTMQVVVKPLTDAIIAARKSAQRMQSMNNLKQLALAMHMYYDKYKHFPPAASYDASGKPLLSWRVHLLPFMEEKALYEQFKLDEPWDSEHNKKLIPLVVKVYQDPSAHLQPGMTTYLVPVGKGTVFGSQEPLRMQDIVDGTSNTIMIVSATPDQAVPWTKPEDLKVTQADPKKGLFDAQHTSFLAALCDGSVHNIPATIGNELLWHLFDAQDRTPVDWSQIR